MRMIDRVDYPGGVERVTRRPVWRIEVQGRKRWAYIDVEEDGRIYFRGFARHPVDSLVEESEPTPSPTPRSQSSSSDAAIAAGAVGALVGGSFAGPPGVVVGG